MIFMFNPFFARIDYILIIIKPVMIFTETRHNRFE